MKTFPTISLTWLVLSLLHLLSAVVISTSEISQLCQSDLRRQISQELFGSLDELARMVDISYCVGSTGVYRPFECLSRCAEFENFELVTTWNTGPLLFDSCGYIALSHSPSSKRIIVTFRGTYSLTNIVLDLSAYPQPYVSYPGDDDDGGDGDGKHGPKCTNCTVHTGFMASWLSTRSFLLDHIATARAQYPDYRLVLAGHSMGGAVAELAGLEMQLRGWDPEVTTFGEPRVGNSAFAEFVDMIFHLSASSSGDEGSRFRRVTHINDPVPLLPPQKWGYRMHAGEIFISKRRLPPEASDVYFCNGDQDQRCIAGLEQEAMLNELIPALERSGQSVFPDYRPNYQNEAQSMMSGTSQILAPSGYHLSGFLFAHRDYFSRLGFCIPGGDPTGGWRWKSL